MSITGRLSNLWRGFLSIWVSNLEASNPAIAYENSIANMIQKYTELKSATSSIIRRRDETKARYDKESRELLQITADLETALSTGQDDLGAILLQKQEVLNQAIDELKAEQDQCVKDAEDAKNALLEVKQKINELKAEKDRKLAQYSSAKARIKINEQLEGLSVDAEVQALATVREHISNKVAEANLTNELKETDLDTKLAKLRASSGSVTAKQKWEKLKAERNKGQDSSQQATVEQQVTATAQKVR